MSGQEARLLAALDAVTQAAAVTRAVGRRLATVGAVAKDDRSPVTVADFAAQAVVSRVLRQQLGPVAVVAEESAAVLRAAPAAVLEGVVEAVRPVWPEATAEHVLSSIDEGRGRDRGDGFWTLDPVDGTKGFLRGQQYAIALAWLEGGRPRVGVLGCPNLAPRGGSVAQRSERGSFYYATEGGGAFERVERDSRLPRRDDATTLRLCASVEEAHSDLARTAAILAAAGEASEPVKLDSQCKYAVVARGDADVYLRLPRQTTYVERIWDHAAGALLAAEVGCVVTDVDGRALDFSLGEGLSANQGILCATPRAHGRILEALARVPAGS